MPTKAFCSAFAAKETKALPPPNSDVYGLYELLRAEDLATGVQLGGARWCSRLSRRSRQSRRENLFGLFPGQPFSPVRRQRNAARTISS
jgi:hypothetical protein